MTLSLQRLKSVRGLAQALVLLVAVGLLAGLGFWQLHRGQQKKALIEGYQQAQNATALHLDRSAATAAPDHWQPVILKGRFVVERTLLLDNQSQGERAGYDVWTPFRTDDGALVIVDRGWLPHAPHPQVPAASAGAVELQGLWRDLPVPGFRFKVDNCSDQGWPRLVEYPTAGDLRCLLRETPLPGIVLQSSAAPDGLVREWHPSPGFPPERHYAYAAQWFGLSLTLLILSLRLLLKAPQ